MVLDAIDAMAFYFINIYFDGMGDFVGKLVIDRQKVKDEFAKYTGNYDVDNDKIKLKIEHTYRVADLCDKIAKDLGLSNYDIDIAWLIGMLHDIGRFEQLRRYGTFSDAGSIDHAHYAAEILFDDEEIARYIGNNVDICNFTESSNGTGNDSSIKVETCGPGQIPGKYVNDICNDGSFTDTEIIRKAIWNHSAYRIEEGLSERTVLFCNIIRDADKVDIFKVIDDTPIGVIYKVNSEDAVNSEISNDVLQAIKEQHAVLRSLKKTYADHIAGHIALAFELVFPVSLHIAKEQGHLDKLMDFGTCNNKTKEQFQEIRKIMEGYMEKRCVGSKDK